MAGAGPTGLRSFATVPEGHFAMIPVSYASWDTRHPYQVGIPQAHVEARWRSAWPSRA